MAGIDGERYRSVATPIRFHPRAITLPSRSSADARRAHRRSPVRARALLTASPRARSARRRQFLAADEEVGEPRVRAVVDQRRSVEAADVEAGGDRDRRWSGVVPSRIGRPNGHRCRRHPRRWPSPWPRRNRASRCPASSECATTAAACDERLRLVITPEPASVKGRGIGRGITGSVHDANRRERDRADEGLASDHERDVHRPGSLAVRGEPLVGAVALAAVDRGGLQEPVIPRPIPRPSADAGSASSPAEARRMRRPWIAHSLDADIVTLGSARAKAMTRASR